MAIKLSFFMTKFNMKKTDEEKLELVKQHIKNEYVPLEKKADVAKAIVDSSYYKEEIIGDEKRKKLYIDSIGNYMLKCMSIIDLYTDIERQTGDGKMLKDFNTLNEAGIIDLIIQNISQRELKEFNMVLQMAQDDAVANEFENHAFISNQIERFGKLIGTSLAPILSQLDEEKISKIIDEINI